MLLGLVVEIAKLGIPIQMLPTLDRLRVSLQAEPLLAQQPGHGVGADPMPGRGEFGRELAGRQRRPAQRRFRISTSSRLDQSQQRREQGRIAGGHRLAAPALTTDPLQRRLPGLQLSDPRRNPRPRGPTRQSHRGNPAMPQSPCLTSHHQPLGPFIQVRQNRLELCPQHRNHLSINSHYQIMSAQM